MAGAWTSAIHRAAGPELLEECRTLGGCKTGEAKITKGYRLKARHVIHTVGPVFHGWTRDAVLLASCYENSLRLVSDHRLRSLAFPSISTGVYSYPLDEAAPVALKAVIRYLIAHPGIELVRFVLFDRYTFEAYAHALDQEFDGIIPRRLRQAVPINPGGENENAVAALSAFRRRGKEGAGPWST